MKIIFFKNNVSLLLCLMFIFAFVSHAQTTEKVEVIITNNGTKNIYFEEKNQKNVAVDGRLFEVSPGKSKTQYFNKGNKVAVKCGNKTQIFIIGEQKDNKFIVNCN